MGNHLTVLGLVGLMVLAQPALANDVPRPMVLFDFGSGFDAGAVDASDAQAAVTPAGTLRVELGHQAAWPGVTLKAPRGKWDLAP
jgi:hypothetical protein